MEAFRAAGKGTLVLNRDDWRYTGTYPSDVPVYADGTTVKPFSSEKGNGSLY
jgi:hypothetical protein